MTEENNVQPGSNTGGIVDNQQSKPWEEQLETSLRGNEALRDFNGPNDVAKAFLKQREDFNKLQGEIKGTIKIPGEGAKPEEIAAYRQAMGIPDKAEDYKFEKPKDLPEGLDYSDGVVKWWGQIAHKVGLSDKVAKAIFEEYNQLAIGNFKQQTEEFNKLQKSQEELVQKENETALNSLKEKWGPKYNENYELATRCMKFFGGEKFGEKLISKGLQNDADTIEFMVNVSKAFKDDTMADLTMNKSKPDLKKGQLEWSYPTMP